MHDPRIGRFFAVDPLASEYTWNSPYAFSENRVVDAVELEGLEMKIANIELHSNEKIKENKSKIRLTFDTSINFKILNATGDKILGFEKVTTEAATRMNKLFSRLDGTGTALFINDLGGNPIGNRGSGEFVDFSATNTKFTTTFQQIGSIDKINPEDFIIILVDEELAHTYEGTDVHPPAYASSLGGQVMIINILGKGMKKDRNGAYDFNGSLGTNVRTAGTIAHETGHLLDLLDRYYTGDRLGEVHEGFENNTMGNSSKTFINGEQESGTVLFLMRIIEQQAKARKNGEKHFQENAKEVTEEILNDNGIDVPKD
jgi:hypothetical protein